MTDRIELTPEEFASWIKLPEGYGMAKTDDNLDFPRTPHEILVDLAKRLDNDPTVQWHREHDKLHPLYVETRPYLEGKDGFPRRSRLAFVATRRRPARRRL